MQDWHIHTQLSSGTMTVSDILAQCRRYGITSVCLADHDCLEAFSQARKVNHSSIEIRSGIEIDVLGGQGQEFHLLGFDIDLDEPGLRHYVAKMQKARGKRAELEQERLVALLGSQAPPLERLYPAAAVVAMRTHMIEALVECGSWPNFREARQWAKLNLDDLMEIEKPSIEEGLALIHAAGGRAVLAHPGQYELDYDLNLVDLVESLHRMGLDGLETSYPYWLRDPEHFSQDAQQSLYKRLGDLAQDLNLLQTRGSDCQHLSDFELAYGSAVEW